MPDGIGNCGCTTEQVDLMFKRAEQYIDEQIADRTYQMARYWVDMYPVKPFPDGAGLILDKVRFFGDIGPQYDGFDGWRKVAITRRTGAVAEDVRVLGTAALGDHDGCGYAWEDVGHGMETVSYDLMQRDLRTKPICIKDIRTMFQYVEMQNLIFQNLANISANMREQLNRNAAMMYAIKYVALPGLPFNTQDPHNLPTIPGGVEVGKLSYPLLLQLYHQLVQEAGQYALANLRGSPAFGLVAHPETLFEMYYSDPDLRTDIRECRGSDGNACDLIARYNFLDSVGPFILMPDMYAPRFDRVNGNLVRIFPFDRDVPIEIGTRPVTNPAYHMAEYELVLVLTRDLMALRTRRPLSSVGGQTSFDAETGMFEWKWFNPERCEDPYRRTGRYVTTAEIGVEPGDFTSIPAILVKRKPTYSGIQYWAAEVCPPDPTECDNTIPIIGECPCPLVVGVGPGVLNTDLIIEFSAWTGLVALDAITLELINGGTLAGTVIAASADTKILQVRFASEIQATPGMFVGIACIAVDYCSANVLKVELCGILEETPVITLVLDRPLKATTGEAVVLNMCDGTQVDSEISATSDFAALRYVVELTWAEYCAAGGICSICVPPETDATCPSCTADMFVECYEYEYEEYWDEYMNPQQ